MKTLKFVLLLSMLASCMYAANAAGAGGFDSNSLDDMSDDENGASCSSQVLGINKRLDEIIQELPQKTCALNSAIARLRAIETELKSFAGQNLRTVEGLKQEKKDITRTRKQLKKAVDALSTEKRSLLRDRARIEKQAHDADRQAVKEEEKERIVKAEDDSKASTEPAKSVLKKRRRRKPGFTDYWPYGRSFDTRGDSDRVLDFLGAIPPIEYGEQQALHTEVT